MDNAVVRHLVNAGRDGFPSASFTPPDEMDARRPPADTFCPLDSDSSQLAAVFAAEEESTFVLQGPPGTGKSQTITNLIAHALVHGRTVLFVSAKRAALEVVHRRLEAVGLRPFCLETHFFTLGGDDDASDQQEDAVECESILDACGASGLPRHPRDSTPGGRGIGSCPQFSLAAARRLVLRLAPGAAPGGYGRGILSSAITVGAPAGGLGADSGGGAHQHP